MRFLCSKVAVEQADHRLHRVPAGVPVHQLACFSMYRRPATCASLIKYNPITCAGSHTHTKATSDSRRLKWSAKFIQTDPQNRRKIVGVANSLQRLYETIVGAVCRSLEFLSACAPPLMTENCGERVFWVPF